MFLMQMQLSVFRFRLGSRDIAGSNHIFKQFSKPPHHSPHLVKVVVKQFRKFPHFQTIQDFFDHIFHHITTSPLHHFTTFVISRIWLIRSGVFQISSRKRGNVECGNVEMWKSGEWCTTFKQFRIFSPLSNNSGFCRSHLWLTTTLGRLFYHAESTRLPHWVLQIYHSGKACIAVTGLRTD